MLWPLSCHDDDWRSMFHNLWMNNHALTVSWDDDNWQCMFHIWEGYITIIWPLSWVDDNWGSMIHTWMIYYHALSVVMWRWPMNEHGSYLRDIWPCSVRCRATMTTDGVCFIPYWWITMLWPLAWHDDNWRIMIQTLGIYDHALSAVMRRRQLTEHVSYIDDLLPCSVRCHEMMTIDGACFIHEWYTSMLWPLSWDDDNWRSMIHTFGKYHHALTFVMKRWQ